VSIIDDIAALRARLDLDEDERRRLIYGLKVAALIAIIRVRRTIKHKGVSLRINEVRATSQPALLLDVTFTRPPAAPVTHQITIVNPPVLPRERTGNERNDLRQALREMLEGFA
jgi:hypothetical protein